MSYYTGRHGSLLLDGNTIAQVQNWSVSSSVSLLSIKTLAETDDRFIADGRTTTGSCRVLYYQETPGVKGSNNASTFINKVIKAREVGGDFFQGATLAQGPDGTNRSSLRLKIDDGTDNGLFIEMRVIITNITMTMAVGEVLAADITFQSHGAPQFVNI